MTFSIRGSVSVPAEGPEPGVVLSAQKKNETTHYFLVFVDIVEL